MLPRIQVFSKTAARYNVWPFKTLSRLQLKNRLEKNPVEKKKKKGVAINKSLPISFHQIA